MMFPLRGKDVRLRRMMFACANDAAAVGVNYGVAARLI
jgi:hypothetical protein